MSTTTKPCVTGPAVEVFGLTVHKRGPAFSEVGDGHERFIVRTASLDRIVSFEADNEDAEREAYDRWCGNDQERAERSYKA